MTVLADYQQASCVFCQANLPHAKHISVIEAAKNDIRIVPPQPDRETLSTNKETLAPGTDLG